MAKNRVHEHGKTLHSLIPQVFVILFLLLGRAKCLRVLFLGHFVGFSFRSVNNNKGKNKLSPSEREGGGGKYIFFVVNPHYAGSELSFSRYLSCLSRVYFVYQLAFSRYLISLFAKIRCHEKQF